MPTLSMFYGIIIKMFYKDHNPPHFHVFYQDYEAVFNFEGEITDGEIPNKQRKLVVAWIELRKSDLQKNWELCQKGEKPFKIEPLR